MTDDTNRRIEELANQFKDRIDLLERYTNKVQSGDTDKEKIKIILKKYNGVWENDPAIYWDESQAESLVFVSESFPNEVHQSVSHPFFRRMNFIRQLSTTPLQRHLGATHTRFSHSYGVTAIARAFIKSLESEEGVEITDTERKAVYIYCYVHDSFHGPFGHSLDSLKEYFNLSDPNKKLDKNLLYNETKEGGKIYEMLHQTHEEEEASELINLLRFLMNPGMRSLQNQYSGKYFLTEIVDSIVDADRLDYLYRDAHNLGHTKPMDADLRRLIGAVSTQETTSERGLSITALSWNKKYSEDIENLLQKRRDFYRKYYESPSKIAIDEMISHSIYNFIEHFSIDASRGSNKDSLIMNRLAYLTDSELIHFLLEIGQPFITNELIRDVYRGHFFVPIEEYELPYPAETNLNEENKFDRFNDALAVEEPVPPFDPQEVDEIRHAMEMADLDLHHKLFIMSDLLIDRYHSKVHIEGLLRDKVLNDNYLKNVWRERNLQKYGMFEKIDETVSDDLMRWEKFTKIPFIYIYFPTHLEWIRNNQNDIGNEMKMWLKEKEPTGINWHNDEKESVNVNLDVPLREEFESKRVILCGPKPFGSGKAKDRVCELFENLIRDTEEWMRDDIIGGV